MLRTPSHRHSGTGHQSTNNRNATHVTKFDSLLALIFQCSGRSLILCLGLFLIVANLVILALVQSETHELSNQTAASQFMHSHFERSAAHDSGVVSSSDSTGAAAVAASAPAAAPVKPASLQQQIKSAALSVVNRLQQRIGLKTKIKPVIAPMPNLPFNPWRQEFGQAFAAVWPQLTESQQSQLWQQRHEATADASSVCERNFGNGYTEAIPMCRETEAKQSENLESKLSCHFNSATLGTVCETHNLALQPSKVHCSLGGEPIESVKGRTEDAEFPNYDAGAFEVQCSRTDESNRITKERFPAHLERVFNSVQYKTSPAEFVCNSNSYSADDEEKTVLFVTRYEYANLYHSMTDFYNAYQALMTHTTAEQRTAGRVQVIFLDGHSEGALDAVWEQMFHLKPLYVKQLQQQEQVHCYRHAIFVSPGYQSALAVNQMQAQYQQCQGNALLDDFVSSFLRAFELDPQQLAFDSSLTVPDVNDKQVVVNEPYRDAASYRPLVTLIVRRDYLAHPRLDVPRTSRKLSNEQQVADAILESLGGPQAVRVLLVDTSRLSIRQQLLAIRYSDVLISVHGAALSYALMLQRHATLLELMPPEYSSRPHFAYFAHWSAHQYEALSIDAADANASHHVDCEALKRTMLRIAAGWSHFKPQSTAAVQIALAPVPAPESTPPASAPVPNVAVVAVAPLPTTSVTVASDAAVAVAPASTAAGSAQSDLPAGPSQTPKMQLSEQQPHKMCLLIPFRDSSSLTSQGGNRTANLNRFIPYMIQHLGQKVMPLEQRKQLGTDYEILVVEQSSADGVIFNKGGLFNVGYEYAKRARCAYMVLNDVDQVPTNETNAYREPRPEAPLHMCTGSSQYGYQMLYSSMVGGALAISMSQYEQANGYSNFYFGWGQEDDDFHARIMRVFKQVDRLDPVQGRYEALEHPRVMDLDITPVFGKANLHLRAVRSGEFDIQTEGLSNLNYAVEKEQEYLQPGVKKITVQFRWPDMPTQV